MQRRPRELSGGQQQRVALGRCLVRNPKVFLFDEPLSNLDAKLRAQMRVEIKRLHGRVPTTSVFVTHDQVEAMTLGDRVVVMKDGRVQQIGTPLEVYRNPANKFVAGFIGAPSMNFLEVTIGSNGTAATAEAPCLRIDLAPAQGVALARWRGRPVVMGVRPEHLAQGHAAGNANLEARVEVLEQLGSEMLAEVLIGEGRLTVARIDPQTRLAAGDAIRLSVPPERLHFFDPATEEAIR
jgi:multiple sugar transport system ATP-binding protein